ncbi:hypothetical protein [Arthrobacter sp. B3I4]|uniref:hypothetical protein n=1 Tax=Arthrobacter sp. B3I4 TaxID=3042267 RepID=UPI002783D31C|nr:hypothetical protein [Arthrobacter sp. B3I4]MDQ0755878.1 ABC-type glycerol-3-phosphate transport system substrate-binding protein [Arthrobacter sp. B3I4]
MKKTLTVLLAAGTLLGAAACSAPKMTSEETCARIKTITASPTSGSDKFGMTRLANQIRPIQATASDELQDPLRSIVDYLDEAAKKDPDSAKLEDLKAKYTAAGQTFSQTCGAAQ